MLPLFVSDELDPMADLRRLGVDAAVAWHGDDNAPALVLVDPRLENLGRLALWLDVRPKRLVPAMTLDGMSSPHI
jgi:hypothetical protein